MIVEPCPLSSGLKTTRIGSRPTMRSHFDTAASLTAGRHRQNPARVNRAARCALRSIREVPMDELHLVAIPGDLDDFLALLDQAQTLKFLFDNAVHEERVKLSVLVSSLTSCRSVVPNPLGQNRGAQAAVVRY